MIEKPKFFRGNIYKDKRGDLSEIYKKVNNVKFNFIIQSTSYKNVFRGLHFQRKFQQTRRWRSANPLDVLARVLLA